MRFLLICILGFTSINSYSQSNFIKNTFKEPHNLRVFHDYDMGMNYAKYKQVQNLKIGRNK